MILSILIATVVDRVEMFQRLKEHVEEQIKPFPSQVELISWSDNKEMSIGKKRQSLLEAATGEYVVFIDDDDWVSGTYVSDILEALKTKPDCVGFDILCTTDGEDIQMARASKQYYWKDNVDGFRYVRHTYHKTPVKKSICLKAGFEDLRYGEDYPYSMRLKKHLKTEVMIPKVMYYYRYNSKEEHNKKYGIK
jgi:glycosyltransferase involved in cell wall biosynthesis